MRWQSGLFLMVVLSLLAGGARGGSISETFFDPEDGMLDMTTWLGESYGFLPVPFIITEPAVGYGGGIALAFFHDSIKSRAEDAEQRNLPRLVAPSITAAAAFYTEHGSKGGGLFHMGVWKDDTVNYEGGVLGASLNLTFYDQSGDGSSFHYNLEALGTVQEVLFRIGDSNVKLGPRYSFFSMLSTFEEGLLPPEISDEDLSVDDAGLGLALEYDGLDNMFTPNLGVLMESEILFHDPIFGGETEYAQISFDCQAFTPVFDRLVAAGRFKAEGVAGGAPFFAKPYIDLRGIPALRYQDDIALTLAAELRWDVTFRWSLVGFGGAGSVADDLGRLSGADVYSAGGVGFRYLIAKGFRLRAGMDVAAGPEDEVVYLTIGNGWQ